MHISRLVQQAAQMHEGVVVLRLDVEKGDAFAEARAPKEKDSEEEKCKEAARGEEEETP